VLTHPYLVTSRQRAVNAKFCPLHPSDRFPTFCIYRCQKTNHNPLCIPPLALVTSLNDWPARPLQCYLNVSRVINLAVCTMLNLYNKFVQYMWCLFNSRLLTINYKLTFCCIHARIFQMASSWQTVVYLYWKIGRKCILLLIILFIICLMYQVGTLFYLFWTFLNVHTLVLKNSTHTKQSCFSTHFHANSFLRFKKF